MDVASFVAKPQKIYDPGSHFRGIKIYDRIKRMDKYVLFLNFL